MTASHPLITIGLTCYNAEDTIGRAIDGALAQDYPNFEIVVVDDGSQDRSIDVIKEKKMMSDRVRLVLHEQNKGFPSALNSIIENSSGEFIAIFDDDDESHPDRIKTQYQTISDYEAKTGIVLVACYASLIKKYPNNYVVDFQAIGSRPHQPVGEDIVKYHLYLDRDPDVFYGGGTPSCSLMARKSTFEKVGSYDVSLKRSEDCDFAVRLGLAGGHVIGTKEYVMTQHASAGVDKKPHIARDSELAFVKKYKYILDRYERYEYAQAWIYVRYYHFSGQKFKAAFQVFKMVWKYPVLTAKRFLKAAPRRLLHEWKMKRNGGQKI